MLENSLALAPIEAAPPTPLALEHLPADSSPSSSSSSSSSASSEIRPPPAAEGEPHQQLSVMRGRGHSRHYPKGDRRDRPGPSNDEDGGRRWKVLPLEDRDRDGDMNRDRGDEEPVQDRTLAVVGELAVVAARVQGEVT